MRYLSGNIREKLREAENAAASHPEDGYGVNIEALKQAMPKALDASEIDVRLGATWVDKEYIQQFMYDTFKTPWNTRHHIRVNYSGYTAEWSISNKSKVGPYDVNARTIYGTDRASAYRILEDTLNLRDVRIYDTVQDPDGKERRVLNQKETTLAQQKQQAIKDAFQDWIWQDPRRREALVNKYNELYNSIRPREYDGKHITFGGINPEITLREHQLNAIAHILYGGNTTRCLRTKSVQERPLKWSPPRWRASGSACAANPCSSFRIILWSSGARSFCGSIPLPISL